jgi:hypothetical protein
MASGTREDMTKQAEWSKATVRTATFLAVGLGLLAVGSWLQLRPALKSRELTTETAVGKPLFPELSDAAKAASLEIVSFDEDTATLSPFKVVKSGGVWVLPSHQNYPADAKDQLAAAATELVDRPIVDLVSTSPGDQELYGVKEPDADKVAVGETGVGQLVEIRDTSGNKLARLIVGKEFERPAGAGAAGRTLRYVRRAGQDPIYLAELDTTKFTTRFDDWIEKDLLKLSPWDVTRLTIDDSTCSYEVDPGSGLVVSQDRTSRIELAYDDQDAAWSLLRLEDFTKEGEAEEKQLGNDEQLASARLNDLKNALGDLTIVDVVRKPAGLSADLKADEAFTGDQEAVLSLAQRGFFPFRSGEILSSSGETVVGMKDGVEYLLRFGNPTTVAGGEDGGDGGSDTAEAGGGRYLFVLARLNESLLEQPEIQPLPELPEESEAEAAAEEASGTTEEKTEGDAGAEPDEPSEAAEEPAADQAADADTDAATALAAAEAAEAKAQAALEERRRVEQENRRAQEAYDEKLEAARKRVRELNNRFADWYYVVSDAEYAKIRLKRADVIETKPTDEAPVAPADAPAP